LELTQEKQLKEQLEQMSLKMKERKERETRVKQPLRYEVKIERPAQRPATPTVLIPYFIFNQATKKMKKWQLLPIFCKMF
jgi:ribosomal protein S30